MQKKCKSASAKKSAPAPGSATLHFIVHILVDIVVQKQRCRSEFDPLWIRTLKLLKTSVSYSSQVVIPVLTCNIADPDPTIFLNADSDPVVLSMRVRIQLKKL